MISSTWTTSTPLSRARSSRGAWRPQLTRSSGNDVRGRRQTRAHLPADDARQHSGGPLGHAGAVPPASVGEGVSIPRVGGSHLREALRPRVSISPAPASVAVDWDVPVVVRDGTTLRANVFRPRGGGRHPVVLCAHPYGKDAQLPHKRRSGGFRAPLQYRIFRQPQAPAFSALASWEAPDPAFWVAHGYAVVNADLRGFGKSEGAGQPLSMQEAEDYFDLVEWAGAQPWSSGRVGLNGVSYLAMAQYGVAALRPEHLAAICPWEGVSDIYRDFAWPGGVREDGFIRVWSRGLRTAGRPAFDFRSEQLARPLREEWWRAHSPELERIDVPALICASFSDHGLHSRGSFEAWRRIGSEQRFLYTHRGGKWSTYYSPDALAAQLRFFDRFVKGDDAGAEADRPVRLAVHDVREAPIAVTHEDAFPPPDVTWTELHLGADGSLSPAPVATGGAIAFDVPAGRVSFTWTVDRDVQLVGPAAVAFTLELPDGGDVALFAGLRKLRAGRHVTFEGSYGFAYDMVARGWLRASHRELDQALSEPWWPVHTHADSRPLAPGEAVAMQIALLPSATLLRAGDRLRLDLQGRSFFHSDPLRGQLPAAYQPSPAARVVLHTGADAGATLLVPLRDA